MPEVAPTMFCDFGVLSGERGLFEVWDGGEIEASAMAIGLVSWGQASTLSSPIFSGGKVPRLMASLTNS
jgi:hypothetical protein